MNDRTLRLNIPETVSKTHELRFVDRAGRYMLQQLSKVKNGRVLLEDRWQDVPLVKEPVK